MKPISEHLYCPRCGSNNLWNDGSYFYGTKKHSYECKDCHRNFTEDSLDPFYRYEFPRNVVIFAIYECFRIPASFAGTARLLEDLGIKVTGKTVGEWVHKFGKFLDVPKNRKVLRQKIEFSDIWHIDETYLKINGKKGWLFEVVDDKGNLVALYFSKHKNAKSAEIALEKAKQRSGIQPRCVTRDGSKSYDKALKKKDLRDTIQVKAHFRGKLAPIIDENGELMRLSNNRVEGQHAITKMHTKLRRGEKSLEKSNLFFNAKEFFQNLFKNAPKCEPSSQSYRLRIFRPPRIPLACFV